MILSLYKNNNMKMLISSSGGNAGHSVATVGEKLNIPVRKLSSLSTFLFLHLFAYLFTYLN